MTKFDLSNMDGKERAYILNKIKEHEELESINDIVLQYDEYSKLFFVSNANDDILGLLDARLGKTTEYENDEISKTLIPVEKHGYSYMSYKTGKGYEPSDMGWIFIPSILNGNTTKKVLSDEDQERFGRPRWRKSTLELSEMSTDKVYEALANETNDFQTQLERLFGLGLGENHEEETVVPTTRVDQVKLNSFLLLLDQVYHGLNDLSGEWYVKFKNNQKKENITKSIQCDVCKKIFPEDVMGTVDFKWYCPDCHDEEFKTTNERPPIHEHNMEN